MIDHLSKRHTQARKTRRIMRVAQIGLGLTLCACLGVGGSYFARAQEAPLPVLSIPPLPKPQKLVMLSFDRDPMQPLVTKTISAAAKEVMHAPTARVAMNLTNIRLCMTVTDENPTGALFFDGQTWIDAVRGDSPFGLPITMIGEGYVVFQDMTFLRQSSCAPDGQQQQNTSQSDQYNLNPIGTAASQQGLTTTTSSAGPLNYNNAQESNSVYGSTPPTSSVIIPGVSGTSDTTTSTTTTNTYDSVYGQSAPTPGPYYPRSPSSTPQPGQQQ